MQFKTILAAGLAASALLAGTPATAQSTCSGGNTSPAGDAGTRGQGGQTREEAQAAEQAAAGSTGRTSAERNVDEMADKERAEEVRRATCSFGGIEFGVGISYTHDLGRHDRVSRAEVVNGVVRVMDDDNGRARIMLESHYFLKPDHRFLNMVQPGMWGWGPFVAVQPGEGQVIDAIGAGLMLGLRRDAAKTESFNLGLGVVVDPNTRILGDGIVANQPLPPGEPDVRYRETMQWGLLFMASFAF